MSHRPPAKINRSIDEEVEGIKSREAPQGQTATSSDCIDTIAFQVWLSKVMIKPLSYAPPCTIDSPVNLGEATQAIACWALIARRRGWRMETNECARQRPGCPQRDGCA